MLYLMKLSICDADGCLLKVRMVEVERWLDAVQELMSQDATKQGEAERLQEELNQCKVRGG
jgi:hypothetical protein